MDEVFPGVFLVEESEEGGGWRALTWFVDTPEGGVLVDPQSFGPATAKAVDRLGGAKLVFVTHALAAGDACKFRERYKARLVAHRALSGAVAACGIDLPFDADFSIVQGIRAVHAGAHSAGSSMLYVMRDRGFLFAGEFLTISGAHGLTTLQVRDRGDPAAQRRVLTHLRSLKFGAVLPFHTRHATANHVLTSPTTTVEALISRGVYAPS